MTIRTKSVVCAALAASVLVSACTSDDSNNPVTVSLIGEHDQIEAPLTNIASSAGRTIFGATAQGLVSINATGDVVPGLAQRWIVVDDGLGYIFRLRRAHWANGAKVDAKQVKQLLEARIRAARRIDPYGDMSSVSDIMAMTGDVLEIRLATARPNFLLALAAPEMGLALKDGGSGPFRKSADSVERQVLVLSPADEFRNSEDAEDRLSNTRQVRAERAAKAVARFQLGKVDLVLGGTLADLPYVTAAELDGKTVRLDPVQGLFGLALSPDKPMFDDPNIREALSMAIEREAIIAYFGVSRWKIADRILPQQLNLPQPPSAPEWGRLSIEERRNRAIGTITRWQAQHGDKPVTLTIALPRGPGMGLLFVVLKDQYRRIGVTLERAEKNADLTLIDEVAPYDSASWYLGQLSCTKDIHCVKEAEDPLKQSTQSGALADRLLLLGQVEPAIQAHNGFIPLAMPVRWSLVRSRLDGFAPSPRGYHPLAELLK